MAWQCFFISTSFIEIFTLIWTEFLFLSIFSFICCFFLSQNWLIFDWTSYENRLNKSFSFRIGEDIGYRNWVSFWSDGPLGCSSSLEEDSSFEGKFASCSSVSSSISSLFYSKYFFRKFFIYQILYFRITLYRFIHL